MLLHQDLKRIVPFLPVGLFEGESGCNTCGQMAYRVTIMAPFPQLVTETENYQSYWRAQRMGMKGLPLTLASISFQARVFPSCSVLYPPEFDLGCLPLLSSLFMNNLFSTGPF